MKKRVHSTLSLVLLFFGLTSLSAQTISSSSTLNAQAVPDRTVFYNLADTGVYKPILWGLDTAWPSEENIRRGVAFMGADRVDIVRTSFQPTYPIVNNDLQTAQITALNERLRLVGLTDTPTKKTPVCLNDDPVTVDASYNGNAVNWAKLMDVTTRRVQEAGRKVISIAPFNEPDYGWGQGTLTDFYNIAGELRKNTRFDSIRISGGNTLNCDQAFPWYNSLRNRLDEGNTHQLAGTFDNYASFFQRVRAFGDYATADELHNVMEAMVGVEYGMQTGIWWGTAERTRGDFVKASDGRRLGYAEHRPNWTAAAVYRNLNGKVQAFGGTSERQAVTTTFRYVSRDRDVYYDGKGPQREFLITLPGGTGYQVGQTNAECVVSISSGDDIQPAINGKYILVNRNSGKTMEVTSGSTTAGALVRQNAYSGKDYQQWNVTPVDSRIGGDFSYFSFTASHSGKAMDILNWSLNNGGNIIAWDDAKGSNQQWFMEYAEDGWFYIRSRFSGKYLDVYGSSQNIANLVQNDYSGGKSQQWRFLPASSAVEFVAPTAPADLSATNQSSSVKLSWTASPEADVEGYTIYRSETAGGSYQTIARNITGTSFTDNTAEVGKNYFYAVRAVDKSLNRSPVSNEAAAAATNQKDCVSKLLFENNLLDSTVNMNHAAVYGTTTYVDGRSASKALSLSGTNNFVQLSTNLLSGSQSTVSTWVYWKGGTAGQHLFDFGSSNTEYVYLTPSASTGQMRLGIRNGTTEQLISTTALAANKWNHLAISFDSAQICIYVNGVLAATSTSAVTVRPSQFKPFLNYIGRSQSVEPMFNGLVDEFSVYNRALSASEVSDVYNGINAVENPSVNESLQVWPLPANQTLQVRYTGASELKNASLALYSMDGRLVMESPLTAGSLQLSVSGLASGQYLLRLRNSTEVLSRPVLIRH